MKNMYSFFMVNFDGDEDGDLLFFMRDYNVNDRARLREAMKAEIERLGALGGSNG